MTNNPLADQIRPTTVKDIIGQAHILNEDSIISRMVKYHKLYSLILYGPPGTGKTTIANALCNDLNVPHATFNAVIDDKAKLLSILDLAKMSNNNYVIILEEIHRLNRDKQDILLPFIEKGIVNIFACTTENPYFVVNPAIRSRCQILELQPINNNDIYLHLKSLIAKKKINLKINDIQLRKIAQTTNGDYRSVINILDLLINLYPNELITDNILEQTLQSKFIVASHYGDDHYDLLSAMHKSLRGSDPNAAIYYLARLLAQKDFVALNRRLIACAYEDIGLANPGLCARVIQAINAAEIVGWPENKQIYADIVIEMALSPKSNSGYLAIMEALKDVESGKAYPIPLNIRDQSYKSATKLNRKGYLYPHDYGGYVEQLYLPKQLANKKYYQINKNGIEPKLSLWLEFKKKNDN